MKRAIAVALVLAVPCAIAIASAAPTASAKPDATATRNAAAQAKSEAAAGKAAAENQLHDLRAQLDALAEQQHEAQGERSDASKALLAADNNVGHATRALHDTEAAIAAQQAKLADLETQQGALKRKLSGQRAELAALVRSAYALGGDEQLKLLLAQDRVVDLARAMEYHRYLEQDRLRRIHALTDQLRSLADLSRQVDSAARQRSPPRIRSRLARLATVQSQRSQRSQLIASIDAGYHDRAERMAAMGRDADALEGLVRKLSVVMARTPPPTHAAAAMPHHEPGSSPGQAMQPVDRAVHRSRGPFPVAHRRPRRRRLSATAAAAC